MRKLEVLTCLHRLNNSFLKQIKLLPLRPGWDIFLVSRSYCDTSSFTLPRDGFGLRSLPTRQVTEPLRTPSACYPAGLRHCLCCAFFLAPFCTCCSIGTGNISCPEPLGFSICRTCRKISGIHEFSERSWYYVRDDTGEVTTGIDHGLTRLCGSDIPAGEERFLVL